MKVAGAGAANGQSPDAGDVVSLLAGGGHPSFASLLDVGETQPGTTCRCVETGEKEWHKSRGKKADQERVPMLRSSVQGGADAPSLQVIANRDLTSWQFDSGVRKRDADVDEVDVSEPSRSTLAGASRTHPESVRTMNAGAGAGDTRLPGGIQTPDADPATAAFAFNLSDPKLPESSKHVEMSHDAAAPDVIASVTTNRPREAGASVTQSSSAMPDIPQPSGEPIVKRDVLFATQGQADPGLAARAAVRGTTDPQHELKRDGESKNVTVGSNGKPVEVNIQDANGKPKLVEPSQQFVNATSSNASGHSQDGQRDPHRGSAGSKDVGHLDVMSKAASDVSFENPAHGGSIQGLRQPPNSGPVESAQQLQPGTDIRGVTGTQSLDASATRQLVSAIHGDLRVGVHTEAFGRVTIQTSAQGGQLLAQLSLENAKESAALAAHLPGVEQKIVQEHGLSASVRLVGGFAGGAGTGSMPRDQAGSGRGDHERYRNDAGMRSSGIDDGASRQSRTSDARLLENNRSRSSRLYVVA